MQKSGSLFICGFVLLATGLLLIGAPVNAQTCGVSQPLQLVSVALDGTPSGVPSFNEASISADGRYIAFTSYADNLVNGDTNQIQDVFVRDMVTGVTERVSVGPNGLEANGNSMYPSISGDGNLIAFESEATNLVAGMDCLASPGSSCRNVFVYNRQTAKMILVSDGSDGLLSWGEAPKISGDGQSVAFVSRAVQLTTTDVFVRDLESGIVERVSVTSNGDAGNNDSYDPVGFSWNGRYAAFLSIASNLVENDHNANCPYPSGGYDLLCSDVFVYDRVTHETKRASVASDGTEANGSALNASLSPDGRYVSFETMATNLAQEDTDDDWDVFVHDLDLGTTEVVSVMGGGITFPSGAYSSLSFWGRYVTFIAPSNAYSVFVHDTWTDRNIQASRSIDGHPENNQSHYPVISADGQHVAFWSDSSNLVEGDTNNEGDIFVAALDCPADVTPKPTEEPTPEVTPTEEVTPQPTQPPNATPVRNYYQTPTLTLTWNRIPWAAQYRIQVDTDKAFQSEFIVNELVGADQLEKTLMGLDPNTYYWRVQALDANNKAGGWSAVESFVVGYE